MKKLILLFAIAAFSFGFTGSNVCDGNDYFVSGTVSKMGYYKADGTQTGTGTSKVTSVTTSGDSTIAWMETEYVSDKMKEPHKSNFRFVCVNGVMMLDIGSMMTGMASGNGMEMTVEGDQAKYPANLSVGQQLDDVNLTMKMMMKGELFSTTQMRIFERKVEALETLKTPAGSFECYKISYKTESTMEMHGKTIPVPARKTVQYFSKRCGVVRSEEYSAEGTMSSYSELLELKKP